MAKKHKSGQKIEYKIEHHTLKLEPKRLGLAFGAMKGLGLGFFALLAWTLGWGRPFVSIAGSLFLGYEASFFGIIIGILWGFVCGFAAGYAFALIYNKIEKCC